MKTPNSPMTARLAREYASTIVHEHLTYYAGLLVQSAKHEWPRARHARALAVAVHAMVLLKPQPHARLVRHILEPREGLEVVERAYPELTKRSEAQWQEAVDEAWQTVQYDPGAKLPQDKSAYGHVELLEELRKRTAFFLED